LDAARYDDFRAMLVEAEPDYLLLASQTSIEPGHLLQISNNTRVLALEPVTCDLSSLSSRRRGNQRPQAGNFLSRVINIPAFVNSYGFNQSREYFELAGENKMIEFSLFSTKGRRSL